MALYIVCDTHLGLVYFFWITSCFHIMGHMWVYTARITAEGCQSAGGNAERGGASVLQLRPSLHKPRRIQRSWAVEANNALRHEGRRLLSLIVVLPLCDSWGEFWSS